MSSSATSGRPSFLQICALTYAVLQAWPEVQHVSRAKLYQTSVDITIIASDIRLGYLFDAFVIRDPRKTTKDFLAGSLLRTLQERSDIFEHVAIVHDPNSQQLFFVNMPRLKASFGDPPGQASSDGLPPWVSFVEIQGTNAKLTAAPPNLSQLLQEIIAQGNAQKSLPKLITLPESARSAGDMVALAACLLDFPVAYVPVGDATRVFLPGILLDVYMCALVIDGSGIHQGDAREHVLLQFSCPRTIADEYPELRPEAISGRLQARFSERLARIAFAGHLVVRHAVETKDRVAL